MSFTKCGEYSFCWTLKPHYGCAFEYQWTIHSLILGKCLDVALVEDTFLSLHVMSFKKAKISERDREREIEGESERERESERARETETEESSVL